MRNRVITTSSLLKHQITEESFPVIGLTAKSLLKAAVSHYVFHLDKTNLKGIKFLIGTTNMKRFVCFLSAV